VPAGMVFPKVEGTWQIRDARYKLPFLAEAIVIFNLDWLLRKGPVLMLCSHPVASRGGVVAFDARLVRGHGSPLLDSPA